MAEPAQIELITGEVVNVQLTSETHMSSDGKRGVMSRVLNKMRLFISVDGKEQDHSFTNSTVGVREGHKVSIVVGRRKRRAPPQRLMLVNHSTGQREEFPGGFTAMASKKPFFGPWWKAVGVNIIIQILGWLYAWIAGRIEGHVAQLVFFTLISSIGLVPVIAFGFHLWERLRSGAAKEMEIERLRLEIEGRLRAHSPAPTQAPHAPPAGH